MDSVLNATLPIFGLILLGFLVARRGILGPAATESLNNFVVWLALPALLFQATAQITASQLSHFGFMVSFGGGAILTFVLSFLLERRRSPHRLADRTIEGLGAAYSNTGFMGIPLCLVALGPASLPPAIISTIMTACVLFAGAIVLIEMDLQAEARWGRTLRKVGRSLARNPLVVAPAAGFVVAAVGLPLPTPILRFTTLLGAAASPCALVTIGLFLSQTRGWTRHPGTIARIVALKLVAQPAITVVLASGIFHMPRIWSDSAVLLAALPIGTGPFMLAKLYNREASVTSGAILISTVVSVVTISLLVAWFGQV
jgi:predicted permease